MLKIKSFFVFLFASYSLQAQTTAYEISYKYDDNPTEFKALIMRDPDGTGSIRVNFIQTTEFIVGMELEEHFLNENGKIDSNVLIMEGKNPLVISGDKNGVYIPDLFVFSKDPNTELFNPEGVLTIDKLSKRGAQGLMSNIKFLTQDDFTREFVLKYYLKEEPIYQNLFVAQTRRLTAQEKTIRLFLLVVANTLDEKIGTTCIKDRDAMNKKFDNISEVLGIQFVPTLVDGKEFNKRNVESAIAAINPAPRDIVVFYYSGHGFSDNDRYLFPHIDLRDKPHMQEPSQYELIMENVYEQIKNKGARLNLVLSDCCNLFPGSIPRVSPAIVTTRPSPQKLSPNKLMTLFLDPKPFSLLMTAASKGEESSGNDNLGGFFTYMFKENLQKYITDLSTDKEISWNKIVEDIRNETTTRSDKSDCPQPDGTNPHCKQTPVYKN